MWHWSYCVVDSRRISESNLMSGPHGEPHLSAYRQSKELSKTVLALGLGYLLGSVCVCVCFFFLPASQVQLSPFQVASDLSLPPLGPLNLSLGEVPLVSVQSPIRPRKPFSLCFYLTLALCGREAPSLSHLPCSLLLLADD